MRKHNYLVSLVWTGNEGSGTASYTTYNRNYTVGIEGKPDLYGSADTNFHGDAGRYNPEELFIASLASCHMLWYLHLCADAGIVVTNYKDDARGAMELTTNGGGYFSEVVLNPEVSIANEGKQELALSLHKKANELCFIANSVNFPVIHHPRVIMANSNLV